MNITKISALIGTLFLVTGCPKPPEVHVTEVLLQHETTLETIGFARDIAIYNDKVFVAASQAGAQIWSYSSRGYSKDWETIFSSYNLEKIYFEPSTRLLFAVESKAIHYRLLDSNLTNIDTGYYNAEWVSTFDQKIFSDGNTQELYIKADAGVVSVFVADGDYDDGFKHYSLSMTHDNVFNVDYWEPFGGKWFSGHMSGLTISDSTLFLAQEELGIRALKLYPDHAESLDSINTSGEALSVATKGNSVFVADNWAGLSIFNWNGSNFSLLSELDTPGWVKQISFWNDFAFMSCGENGLIIVNVTDESNPWIDQKVDLGYIYSAKIVNDKLYCATRSGVQIYSLSK